MVHQIPHYLAHRRLRGKADKTALIVIDGLALNQWLIIKEFVAKKRPEWFVDEQQVFALVPTVTSISRQAIFSGELPLYFADSITTTYHEANHWKRFWQNQGVSDRNTGFTKAAGDDFKAEITDEIDTRQQIIGLVINKVDKIIHGGELGMKGILQSVRLWLEAGYLLSLIEWLLKRDYAVYITSDHGNIEAVGSGSLSEGVLVETRGQRVRIYEEEMFAKQAQDQLDTAYIWPGKDLPFHVLLAKGRTAFVTSGKKVICHGGISLEEVVVPFVEIRKESKE